MSLRGQFFLSVMLALLLSLSALGLVACWHARASVDNEMSMALEAGDRIVDNALLSLPHGGEDVYLQRLVNNPALRTPNTRRSRYPLVSTGDRLRPANRERSPGFPKAGAGWPVPARPSCRVV